MLEQHREDEGGIANRFMTILVPVDFSPCSRLAFQKAAELVQDGRGRIVALHVVDHDFVNECVRHRLGNPGEIKKALFLEAKKKLENFLRHEEKDGFQVEFMVAEGTPFIEINKKAVQTKAEMIVMGSCGNAADMNTIFFGSTAEKVLRFLSRPVLCVPPSLDYKGV
ncbi:MAG: hypothetical protein DRH20_04895 [Deltaproteobacteria bacterium]|nr:MAG: hypothetical protein DRH20_04895 [Deltaproteobacteria bacterium]